MSAGVMDSGLAPSGAPRNDNASDDARFMALAFTLGRRGLGNTWPNPAVGAVIVKDNVIVGRGWTQAAVGRMPRSRRCAAPRRRRKAPRCT